MDVYYSQRMQKAIKSSKIDGVDYIQCTLVPSPHIDRVWRAVITGSSGYNELCENLVGARIARYPPSEDWSEAYRKYCETRQKVKQSSQLLKECPTLWPEYTFDQFKLDYESEAEYNRQMHGQIVTYISNLCSNESKDCNLATVERFIGEIIDEFQYSGDDTRVEAPDVNNDVFHPNYKQFLNLPPEEVWELVEDIDFPSSLTYEL